MDKPTERAVNDPLWHEVWNTMRIIGDAAAAPLLRSLLISDKMNHTKLALEGTEENGWTLLHGTACFQCLECAKILLSGKDPEALLRMIDLRTRHQKSSASDIASRWQGGAEIVRLINARKKELLEGSEKKLSFHKDRLHESEDSDEILTDDDSDDKSHAINIQIASELHGGRSAEWWSIWNAMHMHTRRNIQAASILKRLLRTAFILEVNETSFRPETFQMSLLHFACLSGAVNCVILLLRTRFPKNQDYCIRDPDTLFDAKGRTPDDLARQFHCRDCLEALKDARRVRFGNASRPEVPRGSKRSVTWWHIWRSLGDFEDPSNTEALLSSFIDMQESEMPEIAASRKIGQENQRAKHKEQVDTIEEIDEVRLPADVGNASGQSLLYQAAANGNVLAIKVLLDYGGFAHDLSLEGNSARAIAISLKRTNVIEIFRNLQIDGKIEEEANGD